jgi:hypothetical protein
MLKQSILTLFCTWLLVSCGEANSNNVATNENHSNENLATSDTVINQDLADTLVFEEQSLGAAWQNFEHPFAHFTGNLSDTVRIGPTRAIQDPFDYFSETRSNQFVIIDEGEYVGNSAIWLDGENLIVEGDGKVSILLDVLYDNVMWIAGNNMVINNLHMTHLQPGGSEGQNCSGRVIGFDGADNITVVNCDLNGCGLSGLHDNLGNGTVYAEYNYIHNNSLGAYTDIDGKVWQKEEEHPVFKFKQNLIEDNGHGLNQELYYEEDDDGDY